MKRLSLGVIDFRSLPSVGKKKTSTIENPFFFEVLLAMQKTKKLALEDVPSWLFICRDEKAEAHVTSFVESNTILKTFLVDYSLYFAGKNDRLGDLAVAKTPEKVFLIFLQHPKNSNQVKIPTKFNCPETTQYMKACAYNKLEYRIFNTELRMKFYLWLMKAFSKSGKAIFSAFTGGKLTCAAVVSTVTTV